ncbi:polysaccharide deacetylase family protein, partial [Sphaerisporangium sp. NPDC049002]|uniref:polysaccharide deacetylase family protein n=1 Tax=Sphaerisporangium sp. NPDC049002 TaxID=3155392 RepID=UPI0033DF2173
MLGDLLGGDGVVAAAGAVADEGIGVGGHGVREVPHGVGGDQGAVGAAGQADGNGSVRVGGCQALHAFDQRGYLSWQQLRHLADDPLVMVANHTLTHDNLQALSRDALDEEIKRSHALFTTRMGRPARYFTVPFGRFTQELALDCLEQDELVRPGRRHGMTSHEITSGLHDPALSRVPGDPGAL